MPRHQRVERGGRRREVALGDAGQRGAGLLGDGGHGEERRRGGRIDRPGHFRLRPRRRRLARRGGAGDKARDKAGDEAGGEDQREDRRAAGPAAGARGRAGRQGGILRSLLRLMLDVPGGLHACDAGGKHSRDFDPVKPPAAAGAAVAHGRPSAHGDGEQLSILINLG